MSSNGFEFVDAHVHFYDMQHPTLHYGHWQPDEDHPFLGSQTRILGSKNYLAENFLEDSQVYGVTKAVHVQAAIGSKDPVEETKWLQKVYQNTGFPNAIVGHVNLRDSEAGHMIERHLDHNNFKGVRDFSYGEYLVSNQFRRGFALLEQYSLVSSIAAQWQDMDNLADLAQTYPNITIVLDHAGFPRNEVLNISPIGKLEWKNFRIPTTFFAKYQALVWATITGLQNLLDRMLRHASNFSEQTDLYSPRIGL